MFAISMSSHEHNCENLYRSIGVHYTNYFPEHGKIMPSNFILILIDQLERDLLRKFSFCQTDNTANTVIITWVTRLSLDSHIKALLELTINFFNYIIF